MKKIIYLALLAFVAFAPFLFTSCERDYWYDDGAWRYRNWYGRNGGNNGNNNNNNSTIEDEGACLLGTWVGEMIYTYPEDGTIGQARFGAEMVFKKNSSNSYTEGVGTEIDRAGEDTQTLAFTWYIDKSGNIYIRYTDTGKTFLLDVQSTTKGFYLDDNNFNGFMVAQKDIEEIEFSFTRSGNSSRHAPAKVKFKTDTTGIPYKLVKR